MELQPGVCFAEAVNLLKAGGLPSVHVIATTNKLLATLRTRHTSGELATSDALRDALRDEAKTILRGGAG